MACDRVDLRIVDELPSMETKPSDQPESAYTIRQDTGCENVGNTFTDLDVAKVMCNTESDGYCIGLVTDSSLEEYQLCIGDGTLESGLVANAPGKKNHF